MEKQILNKTDVAEFFGVCRRTIYEWRKKNYGPKFYKTPSGREVTTRELCEKFLSDPSASGDQQ